MAKHLKYVKKRNSRTFGFANWFNHSMKFISNVKSNSHYLSIEIWIFLLQFNDFISLVNKVFVWKLMTSFTIWLCKSNEWWKDQNDLTAEMSVMFYRNGNGKEMNRIENRTWKLRPRSIIEIEIKLYCWSKSTKDLNARKKPEHADLFNFPLSILHICKIKMMEFSSIFLRSDWLKYRNWSEFDSQFSF